MMTKPTDFVLIFDGVTLLLIFSVSWEILYNEQQTSESKTCT